MFLSKREGQAMVVLFRENSESSVFSFDGPLLVCSSNEAELFAVWRKFKSCREQGPVEILWNKTPFDHLMGQGLYCTDTSICVTHLCRTFVDTLVSDTFRHFHPFFMDFFSAF